MKTFYLAFTLLLLGAHGAAPGGRQQQQGPPLRLTTEIVGHRYCAGDKLHILQLRLRLRYRNTGDRKLIVYQGKNLFYQTKIRGAAEGRPYEVVVLNSRFNDAQAEVINSPKPGGAFVTLAPGGVYETEMVVGVGVAAGAAERGANSIAPGEHTLRVVASSWYESKKLAEELRGRWQGSGLLWVEPVVSEPLTFTAARDEQAPRCR
ncbi:MAG TPA: hypothetical protein VF659_13010 [Pyrinomonadaceae bacterium]|jgi:hypothetical protein